jgi:DNA-binding protein HU-beta
MWLLLFCTGGDDKNKIKGLKEKIKMNKKELVKAISEKLEITQKAAGEQLEVMLEVITEELVNGGEVKISGFGTFSVAERAAREGRNPQTGETIQIAASKAPKFKAAKALKDVVNE